MLFTLMCLTAAGMAVYQVHKKLSGSGGAELSELTKGTRIKVFWPAMDEWYPGTIKDSLVQDGVLIHQIRYDDKWVEWRALEEGHWKHLPARPKRPAPAALGSNSL